MFIHRKDKSKPKLSWNEKRTQRLEAKKAKLMMSKADRKARKLDIKKAKIQGKQKHVSSFRKHITALPFAGSRVLQGFAGFSAAGAFYQYESHDLMLTGIFGGATFAISLVSAAPYLKSVARTNKTLSEVQTALTKMDSFVGANEQVIAAVVTDVEKILQQKGYAPESIKQLHQKMDNLQRSLDAKLAQPSSAPKSDVHTAPQNAQKSKNNVVAE